MKSDPQYMVEQFHRKFGCRIGASGISPSDHALLHRARLIVSEAAEYLDAADKRNLVDMCDAIADILYVTYGAAVEIGVDIAPIFTEVHRSNMSKGDAGTDSGGKVMKGPSYSPPDIRGELVKQGWDLS